MQVHTHLHLFHWGLFSSTCPQATGWVADAERGEQIWAYRANSMRIKPFSRLNESVWVPGRLCAFYLAIIHNCINSEREIRVWMNWNNLAKMYGYKMEWYSDIQLGFLVGFMIAVLSWAIVQGQYVFMLNIDVILPGRSYMCGGLIMLPPKQIWTPMGVILNPDMLIYLRKLISLASGKCDSNFKSMIFKLIVQLVA